MKISPQEGNESSPFDMYPGIEQKSKKSLFMPENIFSGPKLYPLHFHDFQEKRKIHMFNFLDVSFQKQLQQPPGELILLKFCQNVPNRQKVKVTKFGTARFSLRKPKVFALQILQRYLTKEGRVRKFSTV